MLAQRHPVIAKIQASSPAQNPLQDGESASPHGVVRHSQAPPDTTAEQWPPFPHVPTHFPSSNWHSRCATVVVVVVGAPGTPVVVVSGTPVVVVTDEKGVVGTQRSREPRKLTRR